MIFMNNEEPKLDGYEPMNMGVSPVDNTLESSSIVSESLDTNASVPSENVDSLSNTGEVIQPTEKIENMDNLSDVNQPEQVIQSQGDVNQSAEVSVDTSVAVDTIQAMPIDSSASLTQDINLTADNVSPVVEGGITQSVTDDGVTQTVEPINTPVSTENEVKKSDKKKSKLPFILIILIVLVGAGLAVYFLLFKNAVNPYTITTSIFDELASSYSDAMDDVNSFVFPVSGKATQSIVDYSIKVDNDSISGSVSSILDVSNKLMKVNYSLDDNNAPYEINALLSKDAIYFNNDETFGTNYMKKVNLESFFDSISQKSDTQDIILTLINSLKKSCEKTFNGKEFKKTTENGLTKYSLVITPQMQYDISSQFVKDLKEALKEDYKELSDLIDDSLDKDEFVKNTIDINYNLYMNGLELKKIEIRDASGANVSVNFETAKTTINMETSVSNNGNLDDSDEYSDISSSEISKMEIVISKTQLNVSVFYDDTELVLNWNKNADYSLSTTKDGKTTGLLSGTLKFENTVSHKSIDFTFNTEIGKIIMGDSNENTKISGSFNLENKVLDKFSTTLPNNALDIDVEDNMDKAMEEFGSLGILLSLFANNSFSSEDL